MIILFFYSQIIIPVYNINLVDNREYLFESEEYRIILYIEIINSDINSIITKNKSIISLEILYNYRFDTIMEYNFDNIFLTVMELENEESIVDLATRKLQIVYKFFWIKKIFIILADIAVIFQIYSNIKKFQKQTTIMETILGNRIIIHGSSDIIRQIAKIIKKYFQL